MESSSPVGLLPSPRQAKFLEMTIVLSILMLIPFLHSQGMNLDYTNLKTAIKIVDNFLASTTRKVDEWMVNFLPSFRSDFTWWARIFIAYPFFSTFLGLVFCEFNKVVPHCTFPMIFQFIRLYGGSLFTAIIIVGVWLLVYFKATSPGIFLSNCQWMLLFFIEMEFHPMYHIYLSNPASELIKQIRDLWGYLKSLVMQVIHFSQEIVPGNDISVAVDIPNPDTGRTERGWDQLQNWIKNCIRNHLKEWIKSFIRQLLGKVKWYLLIMILCVILWWLYKCWSQHPHSRNNPDDDNDDGDGPKNDDAGNDSSNHDVSGGGGGGGGGGGDDDDDDDDDGGGGGGGGHFHLLRPFHAVTDGLFHHLHCGGVSGAPRTSVVSLAAAFQQAAAMLLHHCRSRSTDLFQLLRTSVALLVTSLGHAMVVVIHIVGARSTDLFQLLRMSVALLVTLLRHAMVAVIHIVGARSTDLF
jgi:hypothetical protein